MSRQQTSRCRILADQSGATIVEFGLVSTVFVTTLLGFLDLGHSLYMQSVLQGAVQKSARDATLESGKSEARQSQLDATVRERVEHLAANSSVTFSRRYFRDFTKRPKPLQSPSRTSTTMVAAMMMNRFRTIITIRYGTAMAVTMDKAAPRTMSYILSKSRIHACSPWRGS